MSIDFKQERRWKISTAYAISQSILEWHKSQDKKLLCVKTRSKFIYKSVTESPEISVIAAPKSNQDPNAMDIDLISVPKSIDLDSMDVDSKPDKIPLLIVDENLNTYTTTGPNSIEHFKSKEIETFTGSNDNLYRDIYTSTNRVAAMSKLMTNKTFVKIGSRWNDDGSLINQTPWRDGDVFDFKVNDASEVASLQCIYC